VRAETWTISPLWVPVLVLVVVEELGLRRLMARCAPASARRWRRRGFTYEAGLVVFALLDSSPLMGVAMAHLTAHMALHVVEMFYLPILLVLGAPFLPALFALPVEPRRRLLRAWHLGSSAALTRRVGAFVTSPLVALVAFNGVMIFWHLPSVFNWASFHDAAHTWLMGPSFLIVGYLFWRLILPSGPYPVRASVRFQILAVMVTAFEMVVLAISIGVFSHSAWYQMNILMLGPAAAFSDQQTAAGVLWVCGDFWVIPALVVIARRLMDETGGVGAAFEAAVGRAGLD
jgi:cytochrome c oxidase assembly factor CtaG